MECTLNTTKILKGKIWTPTSYYQSSKKEIFYFEVGFFLALKRILNRQKVCTFPNFPSFYAFLIAFIFFVTIYSFYLGV